MVTSIKTKFVQIKLVWYIFILASIVTGSSCTSVHPISNSYKNERTAEKEQNRELIKKYEGIVGIHINMRKSLPLYESVDSWIDVPYHYGGMSKKGTDCSGFVCNVYKEVYKVVLDRSAEDQFHKDIRRIGKLRLKEGDLVFFETIKGNKASHVGIYLGNHKFVHASVKKGVCIDDMNQKYYVDHFTRAGRVRKTKLKVALLVNDV